MIFDLNKRYCYYFNEISMIPRGSYNEEAIADYVVEFAKKHNLKCKKDFKNNVFVYKPASAGRENEEGVILQAHMDMVCEKNADVEFDFEKDPLQLYVEDGKWLKAKGTTLGADDGYGVSYMLAILEDNTLSHPPVECIFTVQEEVGLIGAKYIGKEDLPYKRYINLDGGGEVSTTVSNSGGRRYVGEVSVNFIPNEKSAYRLFITGLKGGHSGGQIHTNLGNSNKIIAAVMNDLLNKDKEVLLSSISGGLKENAVPREAEAVFTCALSLEEVKNTITEKIEEIKSTLAESDPGLTFTLESVQTEKTMDKASTKNVITFMHLAPNGFVAPSMAIPGLTLASLNMGVVRTTEDLVRCCYQMRSPVIGYLNDFASKIDLLASLCNATTYPEAEYPGWVYEKESPLRELLREILKGHGIEMKERATHGGLETGFFKQVVPDMDMVTYGPIAYGEHTPNERLDLESYDRCYGVLIELLEKI